MARLFFAVEISSEVSAAIRALQARLKKNPAAEALRFVEPDQAHFTIRFLGEEPPERQIAAARAARSVLAECQAFELALQNLGVFPGEHRPHTLWLGAGRGASQLVELASSLETSLAAEGFSREGRPYVPHLTIARIKGRLSPGWIRDVIEHSMETVSSLQVASFSLMESRPTPNGARYVRLEQFRF